VTLGGTDARKRHKSDREQERMQKKKKSARAQWKMRKSEKGKRHKGKVIATASEGKLSRRERHREPAVGQMWEQSLWPSMKGPEGARVRAGQCRGGKALGEKERYLQPGDQGVRQGGE